MLEAEAFTMSATLDKPDPNSCINLMVEARNRRVLRPTCPLTILKRSLKKVQQRAPFCIIQNIAGILSALGWVLMAPASPRVLCITRLTTNDVDFLQQYYFTQCWRKREEYANMQKQLGEKQYSEILYRRREHQSHHEQPQLMSSVVK